MKFATSNDFITLSVGIESDGCGLIYVNGIEIIRFTTSGDIVPIRHDCEHAGMLRKMGFTMVGRSVKINV